LARLESRIDELVKLDISNIRRGDDPPVLSLSQLIASTLASIYGEDSPEYARLGIAADLDATVYVINFMVVKRLSRKFSEAFKEEGIARWQFFEARPVPCERIFNSHRLPRCHRRPAPR
jgi:hypothetical protein